MDTEYVAVEAAPCADAVNEETDPRALSAFTDALDGYGTWSNDSEFGTVWTPSDDEFIPYDTDGSWVDVGGDLVWVSDIPWSTTMHHGRWVRRKDRWRWVPGMKYSGAWVTWTKDGDRMSWAPAAPIVAWRGGGAVRVAPSTEPTVGSRPVSELALIAPSRPQGLVKTKTSPWAGQQIEAEQTKEASADAAHPFDSPSSYFEEDPSPSGSFRGLGRSSGGSSFSGASSHATSMTSSSHGGGASMHASVGHR